ncbi:MAG TPA: RNA polymerase sigma factor [Steroidobacteraceae bacterium]|jgi:RNA polymerase sigma-70 factor (ECF subfamily)|nr:RNA polymerase sigma factor [Steroidobacteraceae bacterium]
MGEEKQLIQRMLGGDEQAFEAFFNAYFPRVYRFVLPRLNGDVDAAREVVQAALVKAMRRIGDFRGESALFTWICQICRREAVDYIRSRRRHVKHLVLIDDRPELRSAIEAIEAPEEFDLVRQYGRAEVGRLVRVVLDRLPSNYGDALEWKYMEGNSVEEIGARLGIGTVAAQSLLARARIAFREALEQVFGAEAADIATSLGA